MVGFDVVSDWGSGFTGEITITNDESKPIENWELQFDFDRAVSSFWNASLLEHRDGTYLFEGASWNQSIPVGQSVSFGFVANPGNVVDGPSQYILNGVALGSLSLDVQPIEVIEGDAASYSTSFDVRLSGPSDAPVSVDYRFEDGTARQGLDYRPEFHPIDFGTLTFAPGEVLKSVRVEILGDELVEPRESFALQLSNPVGAVLSDHHAEAVIIDDDAVPIESSWPEQVFAPYVDATGWPPFDFVSSAGQQGILHYNLGFVVADSLTAEPSWGGYYSADGSYLGEEIDLLRQAGGDVMVSFGGAANRELAVAISDVDTLTTAYQQVIDAYNLTHIDFDIEGAWIADRASIARRSEAIARLQASAMNQNRELSVWFTLPVLPSGLTTDGIHVIESALTYGVDIAGVNIMAMNYGDYAAPNPDGQMGEYAIQSAQSLHRQMVEAYQDAGMSITSEDLWKKIGVTPMIGINDVTTEIFNQQDARELLAFAESKSIGMLSIWSMNRDQPCENGQTYVSPTCSGVDQTPLEFSRIIGQYTSTESSPPSLSITDARAAEGSEVDTVVEFVVTLSKSAEIPVNVDYRVVDGTALLGEDYLGFDGSLVFLPGEVEKVIPVTLVGDTIVEDDETLMVQLMNPVGATIAMDTATGTILDDDVEVVAKLSVGDESILEGDAGIRQVAFTVGLDQPSSETVSVDYRTVDMGAVENEDYLSSAGMLTFKPGEREQTILVDVLGDTIQETNETFRLVLSDAVNAELVDPEAVGTIVNDDQTEQPVEFVVTSDWGSGFNADFKIRNLGNDIWNGWTLEFEFEHPIASIWNAKLVSKSGNHYVIQNESWNGSVAPGGDVSFGIGGSPGNVLRGPIDYVLNGVSVDGGGDSNVPDIQLTDVSILETDDRSTMLQFTVLLSQPITTDITFDYGTQDGSAQAGLDYETTNGSGRIVAGAVSTTIDVPIYGDLMIEGDETFVLVLSSILNASQTEARATGTIRDNDSSSGTDSGKKVVGYYTAWSVYGRDYHVADIPADKLTHINYAFANIGPDGKIALGDPYADIDKFYTGDSWDAGSLRGNFNQLQRLKEKHPHLQTMISVGGWTWSSRFSDVALTESSRQLFVSSTIDFMQDYGFDGIDIDWEYPVSGGLSSNVTRAEDKQNYTLLMKEFRDQLDALESQHDRDYWLSIAAPASPAVYENLEIQAIAEQLDWMNVMSYDFHGSWSEKTNHQAALFASSQDPHADPVARTQFNGHAAAQAYLDVGVPGEKIVLGGAFYGRGWQGVPDINNGLYQSHSGVPQGTWEPGVFDYQDLKENYLPTYNRYWDAEAMVPWLYNADTGIMISYDDPESLGHRAQYIVDQQLGGMMFWELSADDSEHSLLNAIADVLLSENLAGGWTMLNVNSESVDGGGLEASSGANPDDQALPESNVLGDSDSPTVSSESSDASIVSSALENTETEAYAMLVDEVLGEEDALEQDSLQVFERNLS